MGMDKDAVLKLAKELTAEHGFENIPVVFSRTKKSLGRAWWRGGMPVKIDLSSHWMQHLPEAEVRDTILHEIAHLIAGPWANHGPAWVKACLRVGARPHRTAMLSQEVTESIRSAISKYKAVCEDCGETHYFNRMTKRWKRGMYMCSCGGDLEVS